MYEANCLFHHGIKGMRWGVRRFQNEDGSLTAAGRKRYNVDIESEQKKLDEAKKTYYNDTSLDYNKMEKQVSDIRLHERNLKGEKIKDKINKQGGLTKTQQKYQSEYMSKYKMTEEEAAIEAYKRDRTRKAIMIAAGVTVAAVGAYAAYRYGEYACDKTLKSGVTLSRVAQNPSQGVHDAFYAVLDKNKTDKDRYAGIYANQLRARGAQVFEKKIGVQSDIKIASPKHSAELMGKALDHFNVRTKPSEIEAWKTKLTKHARGDRMLGAYDRANLFDKAVKEFDDYVKTGKVGRNLHDALNVELADHNMNFTKQFYAELKKAGYQGVKDVNDSKYSGFMTRMPIIIADSSKVKVSQVRELRAPEIRNAKNIAENANIRKMTLDAARNQAGLYSGIAGVGAAISGVTIKKENTNNNKIIRKYREEHPNSELTANQIIKMHELGQI